MKNIRLCEIYDERHIMIFDDYSFSFEEVLDDLSLKSLFSSTGFTDLLQILKYDDKTFLLISLDHFNYCSFENNFDDFNPLSYVYTKDYNFIKAIKLPNGKIAINTYDSKILIYNILSNNDIQLQTKIDIDLNNVSSKYINNFPLCLFYVEKTNELLVRDYEKISFLNLQKYKFEHIIKEEGNYYIWNNTYVNMMGWNSMENHFCMINDNLIGMAFTRNVIKLIDLKTYEIVKNFIFSHDNITSLIRPSNFSNNNFLCCLYNNDCHGGKYYYFSKAELIEYDRKKEDYSENFDIEFSDKKRLDYFPISIKLLRDGVILIISFNENSCAKSKFNLDILKYN